MCDAKSWIIARREYLALVRSKAFLVGLLIAPAMMGLAVLFAPDDGDKIEAGPRDVALIDHTSKLAGPLAQAAAARGLTLTEASASGPAELAELEAQVRAGRLAALLVIEGHALDADAKASSGLAAAPTPDTAAAGEVTLVVQNLAGTAARSLSDDVRELIALERLRAAGIDELRARRLLGGVEVQLRTPDSGSNAETLRAVLESIVRPIFMVLLVFLAVLYSAPYMLHSVIEEKQQRIAEVLLGSMSPFQLMAGKLLGALGAGLTVTLVYVGLALAAAEYHGYSGLITPTLMLLAVLDAIIAMALFGAVFLAMGAAASELKDAQGWMMPVMVVMMMPLMLLSSLLRSPDGALSVGLSLFPLTAPLILPLRASLGSMPSWQIALSIAGTLAATVIAIWVAGRVFRIGILAQGRAPGLAELWRWIRTA